jgi:PilZ domain
MSSRTPHCRWSCATLDPFVMPTYGDRRAHVRLEVVGSLWGTLELSEPGRVLNISTTGVLIESPVSVPRDSLQSVSLLVDDQWIAVDAHVRRVEQRIPAQGFPDYLIGLEFISPPASLLHSIEHIANAGEIRGD